MSTAGIVFLPFIIAIVGEKGVGDATTRAKKKKEITYGRLGRIPREPYFVTPAIFRELISYPRLIRARRMSFVSIGIKAVGKRYRQFVIRHEGEFFEDALEEDRATRSERYRKMRRELSANADQSAVIRVVTRSRFKMLRSLWHLNEEFEGIV